jgi:hypothetical protein
MFGKQKAFTSLGSLYSEFPALRDRQGRIAKLGDHLSDAMRLSRGSRCQRAAKRHAQKCQSTGTKIGPRTNRDGCSKRRYKTTAESDEDEELRKLLALPMKCG